MHSKHYKSVTIHYNGDYSGECILVESRHNAKGELIIPKEHQGKDWDEIEFPTIELDTTGIEALAKQLIKVGFNSKNTFDLKISGKDNKSIKVNSKDIVDFYLEKKKNEEISELEHLNFTQLLKRYNKTC
jgi:translation initiation factor IF-1